MTTDNGVATATLTLPTSLRIADVAEFRALCDAALTGAGTLVCEGHQVELIDAAGLQLVAALARACATEARGFELRNPSEPLRNAAGISGFAPHLGLVEA